MARNDITEKAATRVANVLNGASGRMQQLFPLPDRKTYQKMNATQDTALMDSIVAQYGPERARQWVIQNRQKDIEDGKQ